MNSPNCVTVLSFSATAKEEHKGVCRKYGMIGYIKKHFLSRPLLTPPPYSAGGFLHASSPLNTFSACDVNGYRATGV